MTCLKCRGEMRTLAVCIDAGNLWSGAAAGSVELDVCEACGGAWFDHGELTAYLKRRVAAAPPGPALDGKRRDALDERVADCPRCGLFLEKKRLGPVRADVCATCGGVWLDAGEFPTEPRKTWADRLRALWS